MLLRLGLITLSLFISLALHVLVVLVVPSAIKTCILPLQTWLNDKSRYKLKPVHQPGQPSSEKTESPPAAFFSAATQTDAVIDLHDEEEVEEQRQEEA